MICFHETQPASSTLIASVIETGEKRIRNPFFHYQHERDKSRPLFSIMIWPPLPGAFRLQTAVYKNSAIHVAQSE